MRVYSIYDRKVREYGSLLLAPNNDVMVRNVITGVRGSGSLMEKYPEDFQLEYLGDVDPNTGMLTAIDGRPEIVGSLSTLLEV